MKTCHDFFLPFRNSADFIIIANRMSFINEASKIKERMMWNDDQLSKLPRFLSMCAYNDQVKPVIEKSVRQILNVFPSFRVELLQFYENGRLFRFLEMKGDVCVPNFPTLQMFLMFPPSFPKSPPFFRVVNPNSQQMVLKPIFQQNQSKNDPKSFVLNSFLSEVKTWMPTKSVVNIIIQVNNFLRTNYPYQQLNHNYRKWGNNNQPSPSQQQSPNYNNTPNYFNNYKNSSPLPYFAAFNNGNNQTFNLNSPQNRNIEFIARANALCNKQKEKTNNLKGTYQQVLPAIQNTDAIRYSIQSEQDFLRNQNLKMTQIINNSNNNYDLKAIVHPKDERSEQILDYFSRIKARGDVATLLEQRFYSQEIALEDFLKWMRKNEESKFMEKVILIKLINSREHQ